MKVVCVPPSDDGFVRGALGELALQPTERIFGTSMYQRRVDSNSSGETAGNIFLARRVSTACARYFDCDTRTPWPLHMFATDMTDFPHSGSKDRFATAFDPVIVVSSHSRRRQPPLALRVLGSGAPSSSEPSTVLKTFPDILQGEVCRICIAHL